jgi:two-component system, OmpR family, phosphate regulon sensor histidine kinase PhoR
MAKRRLMWQLFFPNMIIIILAIVAVTLYLTGSMKKIYLRETADNLTAGAILFNEQLNSADLNSARTDSLCKKLGKDSATRFTVILPSGKVIGDTDNDPTGMGNHANRPEIMDALSGRAGNSIRYSHTLFETMMYVALPISNDGKIVGVVRSAVPITAIDRAFGQIYPRIILEGLIIALLLGILSFYLSRRISVPLERMRRIAVDFSKGDFSHRLPPGDSVEIDELATAINGMASEIDDRIKAVINQRNELDAILSSMVEGVLTVDTSERLIGFNLAASKMLRFDKDSARGRYIQEIIRHTELQRLVTRILDGIKPEEAEMEGEGGRILQLHGAILRNDKHESLGVLIVLNDITRLRHLEKVRRDFVANVSHELRTPITSIKGFVETLQEGAIKSPEDSERFLGIIAKQADRLNTIIADLLTLSQIEEAENAEADLEVHDINRVLTEAVAACEMKARARNITVTVQCDADLKARIDSKLFEQAIINLLENAIKYSNEAGNVTIFAAKKQSEVIISVQDWGIGIERKHLPRLFERFYTVDKARSRELGGTGLGLAIVKHIVSVHHGDVTVESTPGKGSTFSIHLPGIK